VAAGAGGRTRLGDADDGAVGEGEVGGGAERVEEAAGAGEGDAARVRRQVFRAGDEEVDERRVPL
jgi:hypothetical protein